MAPWHIPVPDAAERQKVVVETALGPRHWGFVTEGAGAHSSRTIMVPELRALLAACPPESDLAVYRKAIVDDNILLKSTQATRLGCLRSLRELYALDPDTLLFRALRDLWEAETDAQPLLALLCAVARDPLLRSTAGLIIATPPGASVTPQMQAAAAGEELAGRYKPTVLHVIGRNTASSWQQSGHLQGHRAKVRARVSSSPPAVAYALLLGYLCGARGGMLFDTFWSQLLDSTPYTLRSHAIAATRQGWLEYRHSGDVTDITFRYLLRDIVEEPCP